MKHISYRNLFSCLGFFGLGACAFVLVAFLAPIAGAQQAANYLPSQTTRTLPRLTDINRPVLIENHERIDYFNLIDRHLLTQVWSGEFYAANGSFFANRDFYKNRSVPLNIQTSVRVKKSASKQWILSVPLQYDNGYDSDLFHVEEYLGLGLSVYYTSRSGARAFGLHGRDLVQLGGSVEELPCYDSFRRQFHCGTGQAWTDARINGTLRNREVEPSLSFIFLQSF